MDGVLISSIGGVVRCWRVWAKMYKISGWESYEIPHGTRAIDIIRQLRPDLDEAGVHEGLRVIEDLEIEDVGDLRVLPGVRELLASLPPERWSIRDLGHATPAFGQAEGSRASCSRARHCRRTMSFTASRIPSLT